MALTFKKLKVGDDSDMYPSIEVSHVESVRQYAENDNGASIVRMGSGLEYLVDDPVSEVLAFLKKP